MTTLLEIDQLNISVGIGGLAHSLFVPRMKLKLGQTIILMGPSGSGKSVFMKALSGVFFKDDLNMQGDATVRVSDTSNVKLGVESKYSNNDERPVVFYVFQDPRSYLQPNLEVKDYGQLLQARLGSQRGISESFKLAVDQAKLLHRWDTSSGFLSGGEAQRLMFAIMKVLRPRLVLADEPLSAQDRVHHEQLREMLNNYVADDKNECGLILVTHELRDVKQSLNFTPEPSFHVLQQSKDNVWTCSDAIKPRAVEKMIASSGSDEVNDASEVPQAMAQFFLAAEALASENKKELLEEKALATQPILEVSDVSFTWGKPADGAPLFNSLDSRLESDSNLGLMGLSGVGKSTLAEILLGLIKGYTGRIVWFGSEKIAEKELRRRVQYVFQDCERAMAWEEGTLEDAVLLPFRKEAHQLPEKLSRLLESILLKVGLLPHKDKNVQHLSGGQLRRAYLARSLFALLGNVQPGLPVLLILDEATVGLDLVTQHNLLGLLKEFSEDEFPELFLLVISHDPVVLRYLCNRIDVIYSESNSGKGAKIVEQIKGSQILQGPYKHEHTGLLMGSMHSY